MRAAVGLEEHQADDQDGDELDIEGDRRVRSTRCRQDAPDLPRMRQEQRTIGRTFISPTGAVYRPSTFLSLPSNGKVISTGAPVNARTYDYRRAALHFPKLVDRLWQNLRRCAGYRVQYFAVVEPQRRLAPHLHAAIRGAIPRQLVKDVVASSYVQLWWPAFDQPAYTDRLPVWDGHDYCTRERH